jgi:ADP-heptose:LPS heptosyltransferase
MTILFITSTRVGDAILSSGLLAHLIERHPGARVTVACGPQAAPLFEAVPGLEHLWVLDKMAFSLHWPALWAKAAGRCWGVLVDLRGSPMFFTLAARRRYRLRPAPDTHRVRQLAAVLGLADDPPGPRVWCDDDRRQTARRLIPGGPPVLALGPTANWRAKTWRAERFAELVQRLTGPQGLLPGGRIAVFARDDERPSALALIQSIPADRCIDLVGRVDLLTAYACFERSALYVGNDSGLMHLAAASGVPTLGLFGPSKEALYAPWGPAAASVRTPESFAEIFPPAFDHRTSDTLMNSLSVDAVEAAARELWRRAGEAAA